MSGRSPSNDLDVTLHVDHIEPWSNGDETTSDNLQVLLSLGPLCGLVQFRKDQSDREDGPGHGCLVLSKTLWTIDNDVAPIDATVPAHGKRGP